MPSWRAFSAAFSGAQSGPLRPRLPRTKARAAAVSCFVLSLIWRAPRLFLVADTGLGEGRHAGMTERRRAHDRNGECCAGGFAQAHAEIEQRLLADLLQQAAM